MKNLIEKCHNKYYMRIAVILIWIVSLAVFIVSCCSYVKQTKNMPTFETFSKTASVHRDEDKVGAKVRLKEAIHKANGGVVYRYNVETDCPKWDFKTVYTTNIPIEWATDDTAAVEVLIYDVQIYYRGTIYASGQYYTVPLFGNLSSEFISVDRWEANLVQQAYQTYSSDIKGQLGNIPISGFVVVMIPISVILWRLMVPAKKSNDNNKVEK